MGRCDIGFDLRASARRRGRENFGGTSVTLKPPPPRPFDHALLSPRLSMAPSAQKRLLQELSTYEAEPAFEALLHLGPVNDDLFHWSAILKGVDGTRYERTSSDTS